MKNITVSELIELVGGRAVSAPPDDQMSVSGVCAVDHYVPNKVTFIRKQHYVPALASVSGAVVLIPETMTELQDSHPHNTYIVVADVATTLMQLQEYFYGDAVPAPAISPGAHISPKAVIGENVSIAPGVFIDDNVRIGNNVVIHPGARVGIAGFRYEQDYEKQVVREMLHVGGVTIGDNVQIGANSTVARATFEGSATFIDTDARIDAQVHVGHNVFIGKRTLVCAQACLAGSCQIGEDSFIGAGATISNGVKIGNRAKVLVNAVAVEDVPDDGMVSGFFATDHRVWKRIVARMTRLAEEDL